MENGRVPDNAIAGRCEKKTRRIKGVGQSCRGGTKDQQFRALNFVLICALRSLQRAGERTWVPVLVPVVPPKVVQLRKLNVAIVEAEANARFPG